MQIHIRPLKPTDGEALYDLHTRAVSEVCSKNYAPEIIAAWNARRSPGGYYRNQDKGENFLIAVNDTDTPIGFCGWMNNEVTGLYINPDYHGRHIGSQLITAAFNAAQAAGTPITRIESTLTAQSFYERHGFTQTGTGFSTAGEVRIPHIVMERSTD